MKHSPWLAFCFLLTHGACQGADRDVQGSTSPAGQDSVSSATTGMGGAAMSTSSGVVLTGSSDTGGVTSSGATTSGGEGTLAAGGAAADSAGTSVDTSAVTTASTSTNTAANGGTSTDSTGTSAGGAGGSGGSVIDPGVEGDGDYTIAPPYSASPDLEVKDVPHGQIYQFSMSSETSAIYRGEDTTLNDPMSFDRGIRVYVPRQYVDGTPAPLMVVQDGYLDEIVKALDNLIEEGSIPALVAIFVDNGGGDSKGSQRGLEYDTLSDRYSRFITTEVLPAVESASQIVADYPGFTLTTDPEGRAAYGCSSGGAAALTMGWFTPDQFRRIITYSGTFVDQQDDDAAEEAEYPLGAWEYHDRLIAEADPKPLRVFLHVGENDLGAGEPEGTHHNWIMANQRMAAALAAKGYHYRFVYAEGSGHCDAGVLRQTLPDTLRWMWRGYQ